MSGVVPSAAGTLGLAPACTRIFMTSVSVTFAARKKGVAPRRFSRLRCPSFMPLRVILALTLAPLAIIFRISSTLSVVPVGIGPGVPNPMFMRRVRTAW